MFRVSKGLMAILATMVLVGCNVSGEGPSGVAASSRQTSDDANAHPSLDLKMGMGSYGELHVGGGPLTANEEGELTLTFTAKSDLNTWQQEDAGSGVMAMHPTLSLSFDGGDVDSSCDACGEHELNFINSVSSTGRHISLNNMQADDSITLTLKVTAQSSFTLTPKLTGDGIDEEGDGKEITVHPNENDDDGEPKTELQRALVAAKREYTVNSSGGVTVKPMAGAAKVSRGQTSHAHVLLDRQELMQEETSYLWVTLIPRKKITNRVLVNFPESIHLSAELKGAYTYAPGTSALTQKVDNDNNRSRWTSIDTAASGRTYSLKLKSDLNIHERLVMKFEVIPRSKATTAKVEVRYATPRKMTRFDLTIASNPNVSYIILKNHFRVKYKSIKKTAAGVARVKVVFTALKEIKDPLGKVNEVKLYFDGNYFRHEESLSHTWNKYTYDHEMKGDGDNGHFRFLIGNMVRGNSFTLGFHVWMANNSISSKIILDPFDSDKKSTGYGAVRIIP